ncbi:zinc ribbon domain-containing protein [Arthrobacter sp. D1-29]
MLLIFGLSTKLKALPPRPATCQYCRSFVQHYLEERATKLTIFFIPVLTTSRKYGITCSNCGQHSIINKRQRNALTR